MIFLLLLVIAIFGGLLFAVEAGSVNIEALTGWPIAAAVIGALIYFIWQRFIAAATTVASAAY